MEKLQRFWWDYSDIVVLLSIILALISSVIIRYRVNQ